MQVLQMTLYGEVQLTVHLEGIATASCVYMLLLA